MTVVLVPSVNVLHSRSRNTAFLCIHSLCCNRGTVFFFHVRRDFWTTLFTRYLV